MNFLAHILLSGENEGVMMGPGGVMALSTVIDDAVIAEVGGALDRALERVAALRG